MSTPPPRGRFVTAPSVSVRWAERSPLITVPETLTRLRLPEGDALSVLAAFSGGSTYLRGRGLAPHLRESTFRRLFESLASAGAILPLDDLTRAPAWAPVDLEFHLSVRELLQPPGPPDSRPSPRKPPKVRPRTRRSMLVPLAMPAEPPGTLMEALAGRRSTRTFARAPIPATAFSGFLASSVRNLPSRGSVALRAYPSGGALHSLEVYVVAAPRAIEGLATGFYRYRPEAHDLERIRMPASRIATLLHASQVTLQARRPPPTTLLITSRFPRVTSKYKVIAYSLMLREVGCLLQTWYLLGAAYGLGFCALGAGLPSRAISLHIGAGWMDEPLVSEAVLGVPKP